MGRNEAASKNTSFRIFGISVWIWALGIVVLVSVLAVSGMYVDSWAKTRKAAKLKEIQNIAEDYRMALLHLEWFRHNVSQAEDDLAEQTTAGKSQLKTIALTEAKKSLSDGKQECDKALSKLIQEEKEFWVCDPFYSGSLSRWGDKLNQIRVELRSARKSALDAGLMDLEIEFQRRRQLRAITNSLNDIHKYNNEPAENDTEPSGGLPGKSQSTLDAELKVQTLENEVSRLSGLSLQDIKKEF